MLIFRLNLLSLNFKLAAHENREVKARTLQVSLYLIEHVEIYHLYALYQTPEGAPRPSSSGRPTVHVHSKKQPFSINL